MVRFRFSNTFGIRCYDGTSILCDGSGSGDDGGVALSAEELPCVVEALGDEALAELMAGERLPTLGEIAALAGCDLDLERLLGSS